MTTVSKIAEQRPVPQAIHAIGEAAHAPASKATPRPVMPAAVIVPPAPITRAPITRAPVQPMAGPARIRRRHWGVLATFLGLVLLPVGLSAGYLWGYARDQYASTVAFSIRKEDSQPSLDLIGGISRLTAGGGADADVLYDYIRSQEMVAAVNVRLDLAALHAKAWPMDPVFAYNPAGTIEDLHRHWDRKVKITYDTGSGLMSLRVLAFAPQDARLIATAILQESTRMINALSVEAREDATRYARQELDLSVDRLRAARGALTTFRMRTRIVDPLADLQGQMGVLNTLQAQLAAALIELDLLREATRNSDPRVLQAERRIAVIENRIRSEREKFGEGGKGPGGEDYATLIAEFERLSLDNEFAEQSYRVARVGYDNALAEAQRKSRYLAAHIQPTLAERSIFPQRWALLALTGFFLLMAWGIGVLIYYSIRDRR